MLEAVHDQSAHQSAEKTIALARARISGPQCLQMLQPAATTASDVPMPRLGRRCDRRWAICMPRNPLKSWLWISLCWSEVVVASILCSFSPVCLYSSRKRHQKAATVAQVLVTEWFVRFGVPHHLHSDQGQHFEGKIVQELRKLYVIEKSRTTPCHPEGNGRCERFNRTLHDRLRTLSTMKKRRLSDYLPELVYSYNCTPHSTAGYAPYYLFFGREPKMPIYNLLGANEDIDNSSGLLMSE